MRLAMFSATWRICATFLLVVTTAASAASFSGKVVGVHDGDTITVLTVAKQTVKIRLFGIDAPESKQPFGNRAKQELSAIVFGRHVRVEVETKDRYGRTVGRVSAADVPVNMEMVRRGFAWWYRSYAKKDAGLATAEAEAKNARRGLWADKSPVPPWEFRKQPTPSVSARQATR